MPKGYMISAHRSPADPSKADAYRAIAIPALKAMGGTFLAAGGKVVAMGNGLAERTILIEFESFDAAVAAYESDAYQDALKVLDGEVGIIKSFLSFQGAKFLKNSLSNPESKLAMGKARQVVNLLSPKQLTRLDRAINRLNIPGSLKRHVGHMSPRLKSFMKSEGNFALMSVIGALISMGIYDGLDLNTMKDKVLALDPLTMNNTVSHALIPRFFSEMSKRHFYSFFNRFKQFSEFFFKTLYFSRFKNFLYFFIYNS